MRGEHTMSQVTEYQTDYKVATEEPIIVSKIK